MTCARCAKEIIPAKDRPVKLIDALMPTIIVHESCAYDSEYANGAVQELEEQPTT